MSVDRRQFIELAGLAGASLLVGCGGSQGTSKPGTGSPPAAAAAPPATLHLLLWGSALYAFSNGGKQVEVSYLLKDPQVPNATFIAHHPMIEFAGGTGKINTSKSTLTLGAGNALPKGVYKIAAASLAQGAGALSAEGLGDQPSGCAAPASMSSLKFVPTLSTSASSSIDPNWRQTFETRVVIANGALHAHAPLNGQGDVAEWDVKGPHPSPSNQPYPFTDTLELVLPLASNSLTLENEAGQTIVIETDADPTKIEMRLMAHPPGDTSTVLNPGDPDPHMAVLYAVFTPKPQQSNRNELHFKQWCPSPPTAPPSAPKGVTPMATLNTMSGGPSPGRFCTGAQVTVGP